MKYLLILLASYLLGSCSRYMADEQEGFITVRDNQIHYKKSGDGNGIIFIHGGYLNLDMWTPQIEYLQNKDFMLLRFSELGHGNTVTHNTDCYGFEIIHSLINQFTDEQVSLVGLSWGAVLAVDYALNYPDRVDKLLLVSPGLNGWNYFQDSIAGENYTQRKIAIQNHDTILCAELFHQNWVIGPRRVKKDLAPQFYQQSMAMIEHTMTNHWNEPWSKLDTIQAIGRLSEINNETLIVIGEHDAQDIFAVGEEYVTGIPDAEIIKVENVAHLLTMENSSEFNRIMSKFLVH